MRVEDWGFLSIESTASQEMEMKGGSDELDRRL